MDAEAFNASPPARGSKVELRPQLDDAGGNALDAAAYRRKVHKKVTLRSTDPGSGLKCRKMLKNSERSSGAQSRRSGTTYRARNRRSTGREAGSRPCVPTFEVAPAGRGKRGGVEPALPGALAVCQVGLLAQYGIGAGALPVRWWYRDHRRSRPGIPSAPMMVATFQPPVT